MNCYCDTCGKLFNSLGIARHRAMHRDRCEDCVITYSNGDTYEHSFSEREPYISEREHPDGTWSVKACIGSKSIFGYGKTRNDAVVDLKGDPAYIKHKEAVE